MQRHARMDAVTRRGNACGTEALPRPRAGFAARHASIAPSAVQQSASLDGVTGLTPDVPILAANRTCRAGKSEATLLLVMLALADCGTRSALDGGSAATATRVA